MKNPEKLRPFVKAGVSLASIGLGLTACGSATEQPSAQQIEVVTDSSTTTTKKAATSTTTTRPSTTLPPTTKKTEAPSTTAKPNVVPSTSTTTTQAAPNGSLPQTPLDINFNDFTYPADTCAFSDSPWEMEAGIATSDSGAELALVSQVTGDITGDGVPEVSILLDCIQPREQALQMISVFGADASGVKRIGHAVLPEVQLAMDLDIEDGDLRVNATGQSYAIYEYDGTNIVRQPDL